MRNLATIMVRPRATMRRILDAGRDRMVLPLVVLALLTGFISDFDGSEIQRITAVNGMRVVALVAAVVVGVMIFMVVLFYGVAWITWMLGRLLEGTGSVRDVRSALAWGLAPVVWSLLYAIPVAILLPRAQAGGVNVVNGQWRFTPGTGCGWNLLIGLVDFAVLVWTFVVMSNTLGEAHRFSSLRGFGTLCLVLALPAVVTLAAALTMYFSR